MTKALLYFTRPGGSDYLVITDDYRGPIAATADYGMTDYTLTTVCELGPLLRGKYEYLPLDVIKK